MIPRAVTFDLWNTLLTSAAGGLEIRRQFWQQVIDERDLDISPDLLWGVLSILPDRFEAEWRAGRNYGPERAVEECFLAFGGRIGDADRTSFMAAFDQASYALEVKPVADAVEVVSALQEAGVAVGIVSDTSLATGRHLRTFLDRHDILEHVDFAAFSDEVGAYKPERLIFETVLDGLGVDDPSTVLHVGDLRRTDIEGARAMGMGTVRFCGEVDDPELGNEADHVIDRLVDLLALLFGGSRRPDCGS